MNVQFNLGFNFQNCTFFCFEIELGLGLLILLFGVIYGIYSECLLNIDVVVIGVVDNE